METFDFYIDKKFTNWYRDKYQIEAETKELAIREAVAIFEGAQNGEPYDGEDLDVYYFPSPEEIGGNATRELIIEDLDLMREKTILNNSTLDPNRDAYAIMKPEVKERVKFE